MLARMKAPQDGGSRLAIVFNASPLFTGAAGSGESEIRRWIIENDWLEAIVALPDQLFYNTGISTYVWVLTNRKSAERQGKVQLIDGREFYRKMRKSLGDKRNELGPDDIRKITEIYGEFTEGEHSKIFPNEHFGYRRLTVERPLRAEWRPSGYLTLVDAPGDETRVRQQGDTQEALSRLPEAVYIDQKRLEADIQTVLPDLKPKQVKELADTVRVKGDGPGSSDR